MTERVFQVMKNGILQFETNLNPGDGVFLSSAAEAYVAHLGAEAPADVEEVQGQMNVEYELGELPVEPEPVVLEDEAVAAEAEEVTEAELEADEEEAEYSEWTVDELKEALRSRGLMVSGTKDELIERLEGNDELEEDEDA
jgi:hypothetical protein